MVSYGRYWVVSAGAASAVLYHAFATRQHFYPAAVYLSTSKFAVAVMGNLAFATALMLHMALVKVFFGTLRDIEQELVRERLSSTIMESLLALTIFREEFSGFFVAMFASLVFVKVLHWLLQDRVDYIEATPNVSRLHHIRIVAFMLVLLAIDAAFLQHTVAASIQSGGQSVMLLFAFEYVIQASDVIRYFFKYAMSMADIVLDGRWEGKGACVFYLDLTTDLLHLVVYIIFFTIVFTNYGLPLHLVRDLYSAFNNFRKRIYDFLRYRQVTARLDRLPDATAEDLSRSDGVCIICREDMSSSGSNKKLQCGHLFHAHCLRSWMERQQSCPTCRASVFQRRRGTAGTAAAPLPRDAANGNAAGAAPAAAGAVPAAGLQALLQGQAPAPGLVPAAAVPGLRGAGNAGDVAAGHGHGHGHPWHVPQQHRVRFTARRHGPGQAAQAPATAAGAPHAQAHAAAAGVPPNLVALLSGAVPGGAAGVANPFMPNGMNMMMPLVPMFPTVLPPLVPSPTPGNIIEQQAAAAAAAAALTAAAAVGAYNPLGGIMFMPPVAAAPVTPPTGGHSSASKPPSVPSGSSSSNSEAQQAGQQGSASGSSAGPEDPSATFTRLTAQLNTVMQQLLAARQDMLQNELIKQIQVIEAASAAAVAAAQATAAAQPAAAPAGAAADPQAAPSTAVHTPPTPAPVHAQAAVASASAASEMTAKSNDTDAHEERSKPEATQHEISGSAAGMPAAETANHVQDEVAGQTQQAATNGSAAAGGNDGDTVSPEEVRRRRLAKFGQA